MKIDGPNESYDTLKEKYMMGELDVEGKIVLDAGADYGSTACIFLNEGAEEVISVENDSDRVKRLRENFKNFENVKIIEMEINCVNDWLDLIEFYGCDVAQIDCEGCEKSLAELDDEIFSQVSEYHIECHGSHILSSILGKLSRNGYEIKMIMDCENNPMVKMIWARSK